MSDKYETVVGNVVVLWDPYVGDRWHRYKVRVYTSYNRWAFWATGLRETSVVVAHRPGGEPPVFIERPPSPELFLLFHQCHKTGSVAAVLDKVLEEYPEAEQALAGYDLHSEIRL